MNKLKAAWALVANKSFLIGVGVGIVLGKWGVPATMFIYRMVQAS
jgi:hypothetical protein